MAPPHYCADLHMNQDNCVINVLEIFKDGWIEGVKMYSPIFIIPALFFGKRGFGSLVTHTPLEIARSATFLGAFASSYAGYLCVSRRLVSKSFRLAALCSGFLAGWTSIAIERKSRRSELALYCMNQAAEIVYKMLSSRGLAPNVKHGQVLVFMLANAILMYFYQHESQNMRSNMRGLFSKLLGVN